MVSLQFFDVLQQSMLKNPKGSPFFLELRDFLRKKIPQSVPLQFFIFATEWRMDEKSQIGPLVWQFGSTFGFSGTVKEYLSLSPFAIFEP